MRGSNLFCGRRGEGGELWVRMFQGERQRRCQGIAICDAAVTNHLFVRRREKKGKTPGPGLLVTRLISLEQQDMDLRSVNKRRNLAIEVVLCKSRGITILVDRS